jgi:TM2 domain-containing membrane protein YozV
MKVVGIVVNVFFPGIGTLIVGKIGEGIIQIVLMIVALVLNFTVILSIVGIPLAFIVWVWSLVSAATD